MSHEATNWAVKRKGLRPIAKVVLWHLSDCHNPTMGCFPTQGYLAEQAEISRASVNRVLDELESTGLIRREPQIDPETKRQRPTRYRLAFEEGFQPLDVATRVAGLDTASETDPCLTDDDSRVSNSDVPVSQSSETLTSKGTGNLTGKAPPNPPQAGGEGFAELRKAWPQDHWGNLDNAAGAFGRLTAEDQSSAVRNAPAAALAFTRRKGRVPALAAYIRSRVFRDFDGGPEIDAEGALIITPDRAEWGPWLGWVRGKHGQRGVDSIVKLGRFLAPTRWPEGHVREAA